MGYRPRESYISKDPEKRKRQLSGLRQYQAKTKHEKAKDYKPPLDCSAKALQKLNIIEFANRYLHISFRERPAQRTILKTLYGLPLRVCEVDELKIYDQLTHKSEVNRDVFEKDVEKAEADMALGARAGKSTMASIIALYESICRAHIWRKYLPKGKKGYAVIIATRQKQAEDIIQADCTRLLEESPLKYLIETAKGETPTKNELRLKNGLVIASFPCNSTAARGLPIFLLILDEVAHFYTVGPKADITIVNSLMPRLAQFPGAKCLKISTPAAKMGMFWDEFNEGFEVPGRLTVQAATRIVNPVIPQEFIDKEYRRDPDNAAREFGAEFAETVEGFFISSMDQLLACFTLAEDMPFDGANRYYAAIDQSGLSGRDRWGFSIAHEDYKIKKHIVDCVRAWDTKNLDVIVNEIMFLLSSYKISTLFVDNYAKGFVESIFKNRGVEVIVADKLAACYINFKTLVRGDRLLLPDNPGLRNGLVRTQAYYSKGQNLTIGHERSSEGHADLSDACVRAVYAASQNLATVSFTPLEDAVAAARAAERRRNYNPLTFHRDRRAYVL